MTKENKSSLYNRYTIEAKRLTGSGERKAPTSKKNPSKVAQNIQS